MHTCVENKGIFNSLTSPLMLTQWACCPEHTESIVPNCIRPSRSGAPQITFSATSRRDEGGCGGITRGNPLPLFHPHVTSVFGKAQQHPCLVRLRTAAIERPGFACEKKSSKAVNFSTSAERAGWRA